MDGLTESSRYEDCLMRIMTNFSGHPLHPISEIEAFIGNILGPQGAQSKKQRDLSITMKEEFDRDAAFIVQCIRTKEDVDGDEGLERSMACLAVSLEGRKSGGSFKGGTRLVSFGYIAAAVCLKELDRNLEEG
jgi:hypothetical protein